MTGRVIVVGSVNLDLVVRGPRLPAPGETVTGGTFGRHHGGKGGNQAVAAARLGVPTVFIGAVGNDPFGIEALAALEAEGVDAAGLLVLGGHATGVALILVDERGENLISVASGANAALRPEHVAEALAAVAPTSGDVVLVGHEIATATAREALRNARSRGARTILNPAPAAGLERSTFGFADLLTPNRTELAQLVGAEGRRVGRIGPPADSPERAARTLLEPSSQGTGAGAVIVTLGAAGALLVRPDGHTLELPASQVRVVDTVGAGDAFNGALAAALVGGRSLEDAAHMAVAAGGLATTKAGAREGMPTRDQLEELLRAIGARGGE
jgi:ribokinase